MLGSKNFYLSPLCHSKQLNLHNGKKDRFYFINPRFPNWAPQDFAALRKFAENLLQLLFYFRTKEEESIRSQNLLKQKRKETRIYTAM